MSFFANKKITRHALEAFLAEHASSERTLDIGSGGSSYERFFPNRVTIDVDPARKPQIIADAHQLPFEDSAFAVVLCTEVLEHLSDPPRAIAEMNRVLAPGGKLILTTRFVYPTHDAPGDYFRFTRYGLEYLFANWNEVSIQPEVATMATLGVLLQRIAFQCDVRGGKATKAALLLLARLATKMDWLILREYGDIKRTGPTSELMTSGYYLTATRL